MDYARLRRGRDPRAARGLPARRGAKIVAISSDERSNERMLAAGADDAVPKTPRQGLPVAPVEARGGRVSGDDDRRRETAQLPRAPGRHARAQPRAHAQPDGRGARRGVGQHAWAGSACICRFHRARRGPAHDRAARRRRRAARPARAAARRASASPTRRARCCASTRRCSRRSPRRRSSRRPRRGACATISSRCCSPRSSATSTIAGTSRPRPSASRSCRSIRRPTPTPIWRSTSATSTPRR